MCKIHTIICGTSKSKNEDGYYIKEQKKFWGLIKKSGIANIESPYNYRDFEKKGFKFYDIINDRIISQDKKIEVNDKMLFKYMLDFSSIINEIKPKRIIFHGKQAAEWFLQFIIDGNVNPKKRKWTKNQRYGKYDKSLDYEVYILPSTSGLASKSWDEKVWIDAWTEIKDLEIKKSGSGKHSISQEFLKTERK